MCGSETTRFPASLYNTSALDVLIIESAILSRLELPLDEDLLPLLVGRNSVKSPFLDGLDMLL